MNEVPHYNWPPGTIIRIDGRAYLPRGGSIPGRMFLMDCVTGAPFLVPAKEGGTELPTHAQVDDLLLDGRAEVELPIEGDATRRLARSAELSAADCDELDPDARRKLYYVRFFDEHGVKNGIAAMEAAQADLVSPEMEEEHGTCPNLHSLKRYRSERGAEGDRQNRDMVSMTGKTQRRPQLADDPNEIKWKHVLAKEVAHGSMKSGYANARTELIEVNEGRHEFYRKPEQPHEIFSYDTFRRACHALRDSNTTESKHGTEYMKATMRGAGKPLTASRFGEKVIIDSTPMDGHVAVDPEREMVGGRPILTLAIDVFSRAILAYLITFWSISGWTVLELTRRMALPKRPPPRHAIRYPSARRLCTKPFLLYMDNEGAHCSKAVEDAFRNVGIIPFFVAVGEPTHRAIVERALKTIPERIVEHLKARVHSIAYSRKAKYDAEKQEVCTIVELDAITNEMVAQYNTEPHKGIGGRQPLLMAMKSANKHGIDVLGDPKAFMLECASVIAKIRVSKSGVEAPWGLRYHCSRGVPRLLDNNLRNEPRRHVKENAVIYAKAKYHADDISVLHVWDRTEQEYVTLRCEDETYAAGMPLWFHEQIRDEAKAEAAAFNTEDERLAARSRSIQAVKEILPKAKAAERDTVARLYDIPRLRAMTGNIVELHWEPADAPGVDEFIHHDMPAATALDAEIMAPRPSIDMTGARARRSERRNAGAARVQQPVARTNSRQRALGGGNQGDS